VPKRPHKPSSHLLGRRPLPRNQASAPTSAPVAATCSGPPIQTATPIATTGQVAKASESNEGGTPCEIRPAPLTASSEGKDDLDVIADRAGESGQQFVKTGPSLEGTTASGRAFPLNNEKAPR
jgi:hypothetical protein